MPAAVGAAVATAALGSAAAGTAAFVAVSALTQVAVGMAVSQLGQALAGRPGAEPGPGVRTEVTLEGGTVPQTLLLGRVVTAGTLVAPFYSNGTIDPGDAPDIPNAFRYGIYNVADHPVTALRALWVDGQRFDVIAGATWAGQTISADGGPLDADGADLVLELPPGDPLTIDGWAGGTTVPAFPDPAGFPAWHGGDIVSLTAWWRSGGQTTALPQLVDRFGSHPERPWTSQMVGVGVAHAVLRFRFDPELFQGQPQVRFEVLGSALYDRRKDSTAGGSGPQRASDPSTWALTLNPIVMVENILRGIPLKDGTTWGLGVGAADLPAADWTTAMDWCDALVDGVPRARAGYEVRMATAQSGGDQPFDVIDELLKACAGSIADCGGTWRVRAGPAGLPVAWITDDDVVVSRPQDFEPHQGLTDVYNAVRASHPDPRQDWSVAEAPLRRDAAAEAQDGERLIADLSLPAVWDPMQVQRLGDALLKDARRMRRHTLTLPPELSRLEPLDVLSWTSARNGYAAKLFEVAEVALEPATLAVKVALREVDPADYDWSPASALPAPAASPVKVVTAPEPLPGFGVSAVVLTDAGGVGRRPAIEIDWTPTISGQASIAWETKVAATGAAGPGGSSTNVAKGSAIQADGILPATPYLVRARGNKTAWSAWAAVTTPNVVLGGADIDPGFLPGDDGAPPGQVTGLTVTAGIRMLVLGWTARPSAERVAFYEVFERPIANTTAPTAGAAPSFVSPGPYFARQTLGDSDGRNCWVRAVDQAGMKGPWSAMASGTTPDRAGLTPALVAGLIDATSFAAGVEPVEIVASLPSSGNFAGRIVFLSTDQKLYRHTGSPSGAAGFTTAVDGADLIANSVVAGKIAAAAVSADQLAAGAVTAEKLLLIDRENQVPLWSFSGIRPSADASPSLLVLSGSYTVGSGGPSGSQSIVVGKASAAASTRLATPVGQRIACKAGDRLWIDTEARAVGGAIAAGFFARITFYGADKTTEVGTAGFEDVALTTAWSGSMSKQVTAPAGARFYGVEVLNHSTNATTRTIEVDRVVVRKADVAQLIVDGTITGNKLSASNVITTTAQIGDAVITAAKIGNAQVDTLRIKGQAVTIPVQTVVDPDRDVTDTTNWTKVCALTITKVAGFGVAISGSIYFHGYDDGVMETSVWRGSEAVSGSVREAPTGPRGAGNTITLDAYDSDQRGGAVTYTLKVRRKNLSGNNAVIVIDKPLTFRLWETMR